MRFSAKRSAYSARPQRSQVLYLAVAARCCAIGERHGATYQVPTVIKPNPRDGQQLGHVAALLLATGVTPGIGSLSRPNACAASPMTKMFG